MALAGVAQESFLFAESGGGGENALLLRPRDPSRREKRYFWRGTRISQPATGLPWRRKQARPTYSAEQKATSTRFEVFAAAR